MIDLVFVLLYYRIFILCIIFWPSSGGNVIFMYANTFDFIRRYLLWVNTIDKIFFYMDI